MKKFIALLTLCIPLFCSAQQSTVKTAINNKWNYIIEMTIADNVFQYKITKDGDAEHATTFTLLENTETLFTNALNKLMKPELANLEISENEFRQEAKRLFYFFKAGEILNPSLEHKPIAGTLEISNKTIPIYKYRVNKKSLKKKAKNIVQNSKDWNNKSSVFYQKEGTINEVKKNLANDVSSLNSLKKSISSYSSWIDSELEKDSLKKEKAKLETELHELEAAKEILSNPRIPNIDADASKIDNRITVLKRELDKNKTQLESTRLKAFEIISSIALVDSLKREINWLSKDNRANQIKRDSIRSSLYFNKLMLNDLVTYTNRAVREKVARRVIDSLNLLLNYLKGNDNKLSLALNRYKRDSTTAQLKIKELDNQLRKYPNLKTDLQSKSNEKAQLIKKIDETNNELYAKDSLYKLNKMALIYRSNTVSLENKISSNASSIKKIEARIVELGRKQISTNVKVQPSLSLDRAKKEVESLTILFKEVGKQIDLEKSTLQRFSNQYNSFDTTRMKGRNFFYQNNYYSRGKFKKMLRESILPLLNDSALAKPYFTFYNNNIENILQWTSSLKVARKNASEAERMLSTLKSSKGSLNQKKEATVVLYKNSIDKLEDDIRLHIVPPLKSAPSIAWPQPSDLAPEAYTNEMTELGKYISKLLENVSQQIAEEEEELKTIKASLDNLSNAQNKSADKKDTMNNYLTSLYNLNFNLIKERSTRNNLLHKYLEISRLHFDEIYKNGLQLSESTKLNNFNKDSTSLLQLKLKEFSEKIEKCTSQLEPIRSQLIRLLAKVYDPQFYRQTLNIEEIQIEIAEGLLENVLVAGRIGNHFMYLNNNYELKDTLIYSKEGTLKFENRYSMGFSSKRDFEKLKERKLFTVEDGNQIFEIKLKDLLIAYIQQHEPNRRDYSPADTSLKLSPLSEKKQVLYKEPSFRIIEAKIFSDFVGFDKANPNGLIQTEIDKKISLITTRWPRKVFRYEIWNLGALTYVTPFVSVSKLEQNNRDLLLKVDTINGKATRYASTLNLRRFENFSAGFDLNLFSVDIPTIKSTFYFDGGLRYGRVAIVDSVKSSASSKAVGVNTGADTWLTNLKLIWLVRPDERYSFKVYGGFNWYFLRQNEFRQIANEEVFKASSYDGGVNKNIFGNIGMQFTFRPNPKNYNKGGLFFRYMYNWQTSYFNTGFHQAQVGYSVYLTGKR